MVNLKTVKPGLQVQKRVKPRVRYTKPRPVLSVSFPQGKGFREQLRLAIRFNEGASLIVD